MNIKTVMDSAKGMGDDALKAGRNVWLAGLGAVAYAEEEARDVFDRLVEKGESFEKSDKNLAFQAYYTNSEDESDDDNERDPFTIRYANPTNLDAEFGLSDRHQETRFNGWLLWTAPHGINVNVRTTFLDAQPADIDENGNSIQGFPATQRCIGECTVGGQVFERNQGKKDNEFFTIDLRVSKGFETGGYTVEPIFDIFNLTDEENFLIPEVTNLIFNFDGTVRSGAGDPRKFQLGIRFVK